MLKICVNKDPCFLFSPIDNFRKLIRYDHRQSSDSLIIINHLSDIITLREKSPNMEFFSSPYFPLFGRKYKPEKTRYLDSFYAVSGVAIIICSDGHTIIMNIILLSKLVNYCSSPNHKNLRFIY